MKNKDFLDFLPINFRHEKTFLIKQQLLDFKRISKLSDLEIKNILRISPLCTLNNLKKIRAIANFIKEIGISPPEAYLLLHCGISSIETLSKLTPHELEHKIGRLERSLKVKSELKTTLCVLNGWIKRAKQICKSS